MMRAVVRHEARLLLAERTALAALSLLVLLGAYGTANGMSWRDARAAEVEQLVADGDEALAEERRRLEAGETGASAADAPGQANQVSYPVALPPGPLAALAVGQTDLMPYRTIANLFARQDQLFRLYQFHSPLSLLAGRFDLAFVIVYLLPLVAIVMSYDVLSRERESGTLKIALAEPVRLQTIVLGKVAARFLMLGVTLVALCAGAALIATEGRGAPGRLVLWLIVALAYAFFWLALATFVNSFATSSATNAAMLSCAWLVLLLVLPSMMSVALDVLVPVPSRLAHLNEVRRADLEAQAQRTELLASYFQEHPELSGDPEAAATDFPRWYYVVQREIERSVERVVTDYDRRLAAQQASARRWRFLSPALVAAEGLNDIAGSGAVRHDRFVAAASAFVGAWQRALAPMLFAGERLSADDVDELPRFRFEEESLGTVARRVLPGIAGLLAPAAALLLLAAARLQRAQVLA